MVNPLGEILFFSRKSTLKQQELAKANCTVYIRRILIKSLLLCCLLHFFFFFKSSVHSYQIDPKILQQMLDHMREFIKHLTANKYTI